MQRTFDELGIELLKYGYRKVAFIELQCRIDGTFRLGASTEILIGEHFECPHCHVLRPCSGVIAVGVQPARAALRRVLERSCALR